ncbi:MAG: aminoacetone oxidase family FAD-binding enzyme [Clostridia bacterium]|nr:aminoacetone oxidase family FAD-binding enzyme [Clostridia bacterium]
MRTVIIGAGASGLAAAITLKRECPPMDVVLLEKLDALGKKLLATGNGRCNLTNTSIDVSAYHGDSSTVYHVLNAFGAEECLDFFHSLGLLTLEEEGRVYPLSMNAATVRNLLLEEVSRLGVEVRTDFPVGALEPGFTITNKAGTETLTADFVLLALGGKADAVHGTDGDGYPLLKKLGIRYAPISPALTALLTDPKVKPLKGLRFRGSAGLFREDGTLLGREEGEFQFTANGLSGIPAFQLSGDAAVFTKQEALTALLDFCPNLPDIALFQYLQDRMYAGNPEEPVLHLLTGVLQEKLARFLLEDKGLSPETPVHRLGTQDLADLAGFLKNWPLPVTGTKSFKDAQVTRGGVPAEELVEGSLESKRCPGLWFSGELLNVDGACGGFNLHFAWGSGILAAKEIIKRAAHQ